MLIVLYRNELRSLNHTMCCTNATVELDRLHRCKTGHLWRLFAAGCSRGHRRGDFASMAPMNLVQIMTRPGLNSDFKSPKVSPSYIGAVS
jgi:hypothetical protein